VTIPSSHPGARVVGFLLTIAALSLSLTQAAASDLALQKKSDEKPYALIFGTVWGPDDKPVYGVKVKIRRQNEKKTRWEVYSDHNGEFAQRVPAGKVDYVLLAELKGRESGNGLRPGDPVTIHVEYDERVDTSLHLKQ
jgi:hypothetical protein